MKFMHFILKKMLEIMLCTHPDHNGFELCISLVNNLASLANFDKNANSARVTASISSMWLLFQINNE